MQNKVKNATPEERERAVRLFQEHRGDYPTDWKAMQAIALKVNRTPETLRMWVRRAEINEGNRPGATDEMAAENKRSMSGEISTITFDPMGHSRAYRLQSLQNGSPKHQVHQVSH